MDMQKVGKFIQAERKARNMSQREPGEFARYPLTICPKIVIRIESAPSAKMAEGVFVGIFC